MLRTIALVAAFTLAAAGSASAQTVDKTGKCHDASGKFAKMEVCSAAAKTGGHCRDKTTKKFAKCDAPNAEPVPMKGAAAPPAKK